MKASKKIKPRLLIDVDGVLRDFIGGLASIYQREYPDHKIKPVVSRDLHDNFPIGQEIYRFMDETFADEILLEAPLIGDPVPALQAYESRYNLVIVTAQPPQGRYPTLQWLGKYRIPTDEVRITDQKDEVYGAILLDDFVHNLEAFEKTGRPAVCFDQPWNQSWKGPRVSSVAEFLQFADYLLRRDEEDIISPDTYLA